MARTKLSNDSVGSDQLAHDLALQGNPTGTTQSSGNNTTRLATTAFVTSAVAGGGGGGVAGISSNADATAITIDSSENVTFSKDVGIGINSPSTRLDVREEKTGGALLVQVYNTDNSDTTTQTAGLALGPDSRGATAKITAVKENASFATNAGRDVALTFSSVLNNSPTESMRIDSSGRLLVNTVDATTGSQNPTVNIKQLTNNSYHRGLTIESTDSDAFIGIGYSGSVFQIGATYRASAGYKPITVVSGGYERVRFPTAGGITFNGDTAAANALDDYEEGTWTPAYGVSTGSFGSITHSTQTGYYTKVGHVCTCHGRLDSSSMSIGSASNYLFITGFPFASKTGAYQSGVISYSYGYTGVWANAVAFQGSTSYVYLFSVDDGANSSTIGPSNLGTGQTYLYFSITYITN